MPIIAILIILSVVFLSGIFMASFSGTLVDWINRFWGKITGPEANDAEEPYPSPPGKSTNLLSRKNEIWIYRIFGIFFAVTSLVVLIVALLEIL